MSRSSKKTFAPACPAEEEKEDAKKKIRFFHSFLATPQRLGDAFEFRFIFGIHIDDRWVLDFFLFESKLRLGRLKLTFKERQLILIFFFFSK